MLSLPLLHNQTKAFLSILLLSFPFNCAVCKRPTEAVRMFWGQGRWIFFEFISSLALMTVNTIQGFQIYLSHTPAS